MQLKQITVDGKTFEAFEGEIAPGTNLVFIKGAKGFIMCGYLNLETAEKFKNIAAIATGVKTVEDMLNAKIVKSTTFAQEAGIKTGMPVREALKLI
ncbi:YunC family protein [Endomicrobium proavitum]|uniref:DUF1805 domain-containing protein n=1 Tax=Endomicrobium proavitum TaxID=1408281 RepID=A0A0G3WHT4_9BACT|nr:DUF1805 domain-containing protein [Endomicrobium proavitum]AKL97893.1 hypothetical protein Epro_0514 [Endomicrobium proavitum]